MKLVAPASTYRVQLSASFTFDDACALVDYLRDLGVSHLYCSPILEAAPGSTHGYDVVDPTRISSALGGDAGFRRLVDAARERGLGLLVDIVPNHMATAGQANPWWWDLLTNGPASRYAAYFDVDWHPPAAAVEGKVLLAVLGDRYGRELESGALAVAREQHGAVIRYHDQAFPLAPGTLDGFAFGGDQDVAALDALLQRQHYRLAYWRSAQEELNYRRFFTVHSLIGLRVEREVVFADSHRRILELVRAGDVDGVRVDHVDGLRDPAGYARRLREAADGAYIAVEKILAPGERLPPNLPADGTTGYEFIAAVDGLFVDGEAEPAMTALYHAFSGEAQPYPAVVRASKQQIVTGELAPDFERLATLLVEIFEQDWRQRDRTRREAIEALRELAIAFGVYRTYVTPEDGASDEDRRQIAAAVAEATRQRPDLDAELLSFVGEVLAMDRRRGPEAELVARFQQLTPAVMAKGVEDTAFYRYNRLVSLNEVGGDPGSFGSPAAGFHAWCARIAADSPRTMLTLSTHDTKRSADVRARINLLAEITTEWEAAVRRWAELNDRHRAHGYPDRNLEYLAYQTLAGAWPVDGARLAEFLVKAAREAKVHTSWNDPVAPYEDAVRHFAEAVTTDAEFTGDLETFIGKNQLVALGRVSSLAQTTLLLTCPGVPDVYQGSELWSLNLVDPDNRRDVDFAVRRALLAELRSATPEEALARGDEGAPKLWLTSRLLHHRRPGGPYVALDAQGARAAHVVAFRREDLLVAVPRLVLKLGGDWAGTSLPVPEGDWTSVLTGERVEGGRDVPLADLLRRFPVAVLERARA